MLTNPALELSRARYETIRSMIEGVKGHAEEQHRDLDSRELEYVRKLGDEGAELYRSIEEMTEEAQRSQAVTAVAAQLDSDAQAGVIEAAGYETVPPLMPGAAQLDEMVRLATTEQTSRRWTVEPDRHYRAAVTTAMTGVPMAGPAGLVLPEPRRISTAAGLRVERVNGVEGVSFPVFGAGQADIAAELATKNEYAAITAGGATPQMISVWTDFSRQASLSVASFEQRLRAKHAALVAKREDLLLCTRVLATTGIQTYTAASAAPYADSLMAAAGLVLASDVAAAPDVAICNPSDLPKIFPSVGTGVLGEAPSTALRLNLHGMLVYPSAAVAAGSAIVGAWRVASRYVVGLPPTVLMDAVSQLKINRITLLTEEAVTLAIDEPTGFVNVDLTAA